MVDILKLIFEIVGVGFEDGLSIMNGILGEIFKTDHRLKAEFGKGGFLSKKNTGFNVHGKALTEEMSMRGLCVSGETGSSKTAGSLLKSCLMVDGSQIVHAPSFELYSQTSGHRSQTDRILVFSPTHPERSSAFNPMLRANTLSEVSRLAHLLVTLFSAESESKSFWQNKAMELLVCLILILKKPQIGTQYQTLPNVAHLLDYLAGEKTRLYIDALFDDFGDPWLRTKYKSLMSQSDNALSGVISTAQTSVQFFDLDEDIKRLVSSDTLGDFDQIRRERTSFYLVSSTTKGAYYGPLMSILLEQYFEDFFSRLPDESDLPVYFNLDEIPLLRLENLDSICANVRKHLGAICILSQDPYSQLATVYGEYKRDAILSNMKTRAYYSVNLEQARRLETELGVFEYADNYDEDRVKTRSLKTASELLLMKENEVLITHTGSKPMLTKFTPYYKDKRMLALSKLEPYEVEPISHSSVSLLPLESMYPKIDPS